MKALLAAFFGATSAAQAHGLRLPMNHEGELEITPALLAIMVIVYAIGFVRLRGRRRPLAPAAYFVAASLALGAAVASPLHAASVTLLSAHMIEHELLMVIAAPLLVASRPIGVLLWGLPKLCRRRLGAAMKNRVWTRIWMMSTGLFAAAALHAAPIWLWHIPSMFRAALHSAALHALQHLCFFFGALLFWWAIFHRPARFGVAIIALFVTTLHTGLLGALLFVSPRLLALPPSDWRASLSPIEDQQLAGAIMWIAAGFVYVGVALALAARWIADSSAGSRSAEPSPKASREGGTSASDQRQQYDDRDRHAEHPEQYAASHDEKRSYRHGLTR